MSFCFFFFTSQRSKLNVDYFTQMCINRNSYIFGEIGTHLCILIDCFKIFFLLFCYKILESQSIQKSSWHLFLRRWSIENKKKKTKNRRSDPTRFWSLVVQVTIAVSLSCGRSGGGGGLMIWSSHLLQISLAYLLSIPWCVQGKKEELKKEQENFETWSCPYLHYNSFTKMFWCHRTRELLWKKNTIHIFHENMQLNEKIYLKLIHLTWPALDSGRTYTS